MPYLAKVVGIWILRVLVKLGARIATPSLPLPPPKPLRTIYLPCRSEANRKIRCDIYMPSSLARSTSDDGKEPLAPEQAANFTSGSTEHIPQTSKAPKDQRSDPSRTLPVVVNLHGSGFTLHAIGDDARFCQLVADSIPCVVVDVDYSKAPERPFPLANNDVDTVLGWLAERGADEQSDDDDVPAPKQLLGTEHGHVKIRTDRVALTGFSAGGNLALTACVRAHQRGRLSDIPALVVFYPSTNLSESPHKKPQVKPDKDAAGGVLPPSIRSFFYSCYLPSDAKPDLPARNSPAISPLYADAACFPPSVTIVTCSGDSLEREARQMAEHIVAGRATEEQRKAWQATAELADSPADVPDVDRLPLPFNEDRAGVLWWQAPGQGHAWDKMVKADSEPERLRNEAYALAVERLRKALA